MIYSIDEEKSLHTPVKQRIWYRSLYKNVKRDKYLLILLVPVLLHYVIFSYLPMYGIIIAFKDFSPVRGILSSPWVGLKHFEDFLTSIYFVRLFRNTLLISIYQLIFSFPVPIIFALALNEVKKVAFKRTIQTISYLPHFISVVIVVGMMVSLLSPRDGILNILLENVFGVEPIAFMNDSKWFRTLYIGSGIWQSYGFSAIVYLAALTSINVELYEAAIIDGANRWQRLKSITIPGIKPTITIILILNVGSLLSVGYEKIMLMYSPSVYETADVISTYVYRRGILSSQYSFATAVGLFNSIVNFVLLITANNISKKYSETSLW